MPIEKKKEENSPQTREHMRKIVDAYFKRVWRKDISQLPEATFLGPKDLDIDDFGRVEIFSALEKEYKTRVPDAVVYLTERLGDIFDYFETHVFEKKSLKGNSGKQASSTVKPSSVPATAASSQPVKKATAKLDNTVVIPNPVSNYVGPKIALLFPGQGSQKVGMCKDVVAKYPAARALFEKATSILGYDILKICLEGPEERLSSTQISQPALFLSSMCALEKLKVEHPEVYHNSSYAAGLSLGEYSALCFAGVLSFEDALRVVEVRGKAMQAASDASPQAMVSIMGLEDVAVEKLVKLAEKEGNRVVSGSLKSANEAERLAKTPQFNAKAVRKLKVSGAFHTDFMKSAAEELGRVLHTVTMNRPRIPVISNVDAKPHDLPDDIVSVLISQLTNPVRWQACMYSLLDSGVKKYYEVGTGTVLVGLMRHNMRGKGTSAELVNFQV